MSKKAKGERRKEKGKKKERENGNAVTKSDLRCSEPTTRICPHA
jgi:hypothetical protein